MLSCISLAYKESASECRSQARPVRAFVQLTDEGAGCVSCPDCRLEAQYGHHQDVDMIPLVRVMPEVSF